MGSFETLNIIIKSVTKFVSNEILYQGFQKNLQKNKIVLNWSVGFYLYQNLYHIVISNRLSLYNRYNLKDNIIDVL